MFVFRYECDAFFDVVDFETRKYSKDTKKTLRDVTKTPLTSMCGSDNPRKYVNEMSEGEPYIKLPMELFVNEGYYDEV